MSDANSTGYWALMFWRFHGLGKGSGRYVGELLAARFGQTDGATPFDDLLAELEAAEAEAPHAPPPAGEPPDARPTAPRS